MQLTPNVGGGSLCFMGKLYQLDSGLSNAIELAREPGESASSALRKMLNWEPLVHNVKKEKINGISGRRTKPFNWPIDKIEVGENIMVKNMPDGSGIGISQAIRDMHRCERNTGKVFRQEYWAGKENEMLFTRIK